MSLRTISVFKPSQCCRGDIYCFSLNSKESTIIDLRDNFFNCYLAAQRPTLGHCWGAVSQNQCYWLLLQLILPRGHQEPFSLVNSPFTIEFTKAISQLSNSNNKYFFFVLVNVLFKFLLFFSYFYCYFLAITKHWPVLNLCLFSFFHLFYLD